jgi:hypothetical protein
VATADGLEEFRLPVDAALRDALHGEPTRPRPVAVPAPSVAAPGITPREIQVRVRAGEAPEDIAEAFGAALDWVLRFAGPVLDERGRVADEARRARARRSTTDGQPVIFGEAVDERFAAHGIEPGTVGWDARRREDGQWVITAHWVGGDADRSAEWSFQLSARTVAPLDDTAADLLSDRPIRPLVPRDPEPALSAAIAPPLAPGVVAFPAMADAATGQLPRIEEVFDQEAYPAALPAEPAAGPDADPEPPAAAADLFDTVFDDEPSLPLTIEGRHTAKPRRRAKLTDLNAGIRGEESEDQKAARAHVPSWDDILLGVRRKQD